MLKSKKLRLLSVIVVIVSLVAVFNVFDINNLKAATLANAKNTLSDSAPSVTATSTFSFTTNNIAIGDYILITYHDDFGDIATGTCPEHMSITQDQTTIKCVADQLIATGTVSVIGRAANPSVVDEYTFIFETRTAGDAIIDSAEVMVAIISDVTVTAHVPATLTFAIISLATSTEVNGISTTGSSTATALDFQTLQAGVNTLGQELAVGTNAAGGFTVTVQQDHNLQTANGADIDAFANGTALSSSTLWAAPSGTLSNENTFGHLGLTSEDSTLSDGDAYGGLLYKGLNGTAPVEVMYHNGPADSLTEDVGKTQVAYSIEINALQEAGDYTNTLTYVCTPTY